MEIKTFTLKLKTKAFCQFVDLTEQVQKFVNKSKIKSGFITVHSKHTTLAIELDVPRKREVFLQAIGE